MKHHGKIQISRKHTYIILTPLNPIILYVKLGFTEIYIIFPISAQKHRLLVRRGGSNEYPQSMFLSRNKKTNVYPWKPQFYYIKVGYNGVKKNI